MMDEHSKELLVVRILFGSRYQAFVEVQSPETDPLALERDKIQLFALSWVRLLFLLGPNPQAPMLLDYVRRVMGDTVTPKGLNRPTIMSGEQKLLDAAPEKNERVVEFKLLQEGDSRLAEIILPPGDEGHLYPACTIFFLQHLIRVLGDPSLFFLMLVLGGIVEYYEEIGKTDDLGSLTGAPSHGFSAAAKYIAEERERTARGNS